MLKIIKYFSIITLGIFVFFGAVSLQVKASMEINTDINDKIPGQYIVVLKDAVKDNEVNDVIQKFRDKDLADLPIFQNVLKGFVLKMPQNISEEEIEKKLSEIKNDPRVEFVSEDHAVFAQYSERIVEALIPLAKRNTNVSIQSQRIPTGIDRINAENKSNKGSGVNVAVVDTGIDTRHSDLTQNVVGGKNCVVGGGTNYRDQNGHGTHVAGIIAASNNGSGVVGVAPGVKLWSVRVLDRNGAGSWSSVICGIDFVISKAPQNGGPIKVMNMSLGGGGASDNNCGKTNNDALHKAICRARDAGVTIVVAAGNSNVNSNTSVPAAYDDAVITVSALADSDGKTGGTGSGTSYGKDDTFATFSNYGDVVDIGAPGVSIYSTWLSNRYATLSGTSMASPHVAGAAALYIFNHPTALWSEVKNAIQSAGEILGSEHSDPSGRHSENVLRTDSF